jgi:hypothetical protein
MVIQARSGDPVGAQEFAGVMGRTLRPEAFESFQRTLGARPIGFPDWFYSKLYQFLEILLHESLSVLGTGAWGNLGPRQTEKPWEECRGRLTSAGPEIHPDQLERAFDPASHRTYPWLDLVRLCTRAEPADRLEAALQFVRWWAKRRRVTRKLDPERARRPRGDEETYERDKFIAEQLIRGTAREKICELLDRKRCGPMELKRGRPPGVIPISAKTCSPCSRKRRPVSLLPADLVVRSVAHRLMLRSPTDCKSSGSPFAGDPRVASIAN